MSEGSRLSPEARRNQLRRSDETGGADRAADRLADENWPRKMITVAERTAVGVYTDGFTFAGNFAYLSLLAVFSFFIVAAAIAGSIGQTAAGEDFVAAFLQTVPPSVADALREPIGDAMHARTGPLLWLSAGVGLWTTASLIETIREILHRAYGVEAQRAFWEYRLTSVGLIILSVFFAMLALSTQFAFSALIEFFGAYLPLEQIDSTWFSLSSALPFLILFITLYLLFRLLTPTAISTPHLSQMARSGFHQQLVADHFGPVAPVPQICGQLPAHLWQPGGCNDHADLLLPDWAGYGYRVGAQRSAGRQAGESWRAGLIFRHHHFLENQPDSRYQNGNSKRSEI